MATVYEVTLLIKDQEDYTFLLSEEDFEFHWQDALVAACEQAGIDTDDVINVFSVQRQE